MLLLVAMILARISIGIDIDASFINSFSQRLSNIETLSKKYYTDRINNHKNFVGKREKPLRCVAEKINIPVMTSQEKLFNFILCQKLLMTMKNYLLHYMKFSMLSFNPFVY